jgi:hypothetical protein
MMYKSMVVLALAGMMSSPVFAQAAPAADQAAPAAKPQTVKKRVCMRDDEDSYSRLGGRKICKTVEVPVQPASGGASGNSQTAPSSSQSGSH